MEISNKFKSKLNQTQIDKVIQVAYNLGINPNWLLAVMYFESGRTFDPAVTNGIGSVGLIQFTRDKSGVDYKTIAGKRYKLSTIKNMSFVQQMSLVEAYYKEVFKMIKRKPVSFLETYLITFFPSAVGKPNNYVLETKGLSSSLISKQNPIFDKNKDGKITKQEVLDYFQGLYTKLGFNFENDINQKITGFFLP